MLDRLDAKYNSPTGPLPGLNPDLAQVMGEMALLPTGKTLSAALDQLHPGAYLAMADNNLRRARIAGRDLHEFLALLRSGQGFPAAGVITPGAGLAQSGADATPGATPGAGEIPTLAAPGAGAAGETPLWQAYFAPHGSYSKLSSHNGRTPYAATSGGLGAGLLRRFSDVFLAGAQVDFAYSDIDFNDPANSRGESVQAGLTLFAAYDSGAWFADAYIAGLLSSDDLDRNINFGDINRKASSDWTTPGLATGLSFGYGLRLNDAVRLEPFAGLDYTAFFNPSHSESGADALNLHNDSYTSDSLRTSLGARVAYAFTVSGRPAAANLSLAWGHELLDTDWQLRTHFSGAPTESFNAKNITPVSDTAEVNAGVVLPLSDTSRAYIRYNGEFGDGWQDHGGQLGLSWDF